MMLLMMIVSRYKYDTEKRMQILKFVDIEGRALGVLSWYAVHGTSMNNSNKLISSDNKGYAAMKFEQDFNDYVNVGKVFGIDCLGAHTSNDHNLLVQGPFVAIFAQANEGDSSPNLKGARCTGSGQPCDFVHSTCANRSESCVAFGPGKDMFESTKIIGERQYQKAKQLFEQDGDRVDGGIQYIYENINMTSREVTLANGTVVKTCAAALGFSFAAGTTDGEGLTFVSLFLPCAEHRAKDFVRFQFQQGTRSGQENNGWDRIRNLIKRPSKELLECQKPKAVLLPVGEMKYPYQWTPEIIPTQIIQIGGIVLASLPAEFTTMSGRRMRESIREVYQQHGQSVRIILAGLGNTYSNYVATFEGKCYRSCCPSDCLTMSRPEYQVQRYEGGSTLFGPYTLDVSMISFETISRCLSSMSSSSSGISSAV